MNINWMKWNAAVSRFYLSYSAFLAFSFVCINICISYNIIPGNLLNKMLLSELLFMFTFDFFVGFDIICTEFYV